jgi:hypothetical protein
MSLLKIIISKIFGGTPTQSSSPSKPWWDNAPKVDVNYLGQYLESTVNNKEYAAHDNMTFCNMFVQEISRLFKYHGFDDLMASQMVKLMEDNPKVWRVTDYVEAATVAAEGHLVVAGWRNPDPTGHGHVNIIYPKNETIHSNSFQAQVPFCANVGKSNWCGKALSYAFTNATKPGLFTYMGES